MQSKIRIAKYIANAGYCSRRDAEKLIEDRLVEINDKLCVHPSETVTEEDKITVGKKIIKLNQTIKLWKIYKPIKYICSTKDEHNRKKIFDLIPKNLPRTISIGRLDFMSEGLLLLTNNGDFARKLELPAKGYERIYRVCIRGQIDVKNLEQINNGIKIDGIFYKKINDSFIFIFSSFDE